MSDFPIFVPGIPRPQGSKQVSRTGHLYEANPKHKEWRHTMTTILTAWTGTFFGAWQPYDGPLAVDVTFWIPKPKSVRRDLPSVPPDLDKYCRSLGDAMTLSGLIVDDARITKWTARKRYGEPGVMIHSIAQDSPDGLGEKVE